LNVAEFNGVKRGEAFAYFIVRLFDSYAKFDHMIVIDCRGFNDILLPYNAPRVAVFSTFFDDKYYFFNNYFYLQIKLGQGPIWQTQKYSIKYH
jgi:hypothetical protein